MAQVSKKQVSPADFFCGNCSFPKEASELAKMGRSVIPEIVAELGSSSLDSDRLWAVMILGEICRLQRDDEAIKFLRNRTLEDRSPLVRLMASSLYVKTWRLEKRKSFDWSPAVDAAITRIFEQVSADPEKWVRYEAIHFANELILLNRQDISEPALLRVIQQDSEWAHLVMAARHLGQLKANKRSLQSLQGMLKHEKPEVVQTAMDVLDSWIRREQILVSKWEAARKDWDVGNREGCEAFVRQWSSRLSP